MGFFKNCFTCEYISLSKKWCKRYPPTSENEYSRGRSILYEGSCGEYKASLENINRSLDKEEKTNSEKLKNLRKEIRRLKVIVNENN